MEGLAAGSSSKAAAQLAALGAAASWRLGKWDLVEGYQQAANEGFQRLEADARWEVRCRAGEVWAGLGWAGPGRSCLCCILCGKW